MNLRSLITAYKKRFLLRNTDFLPRCESLSKTMVSLDEEGYMDLTVPINKNYDLLRILRKYRPDSILECGSGTTTLMFDFYSRDTGAKAETHEHNPKWHANVSTHLLNPDYKYVPDTMTTDGDSTRYASDFEGEYAFMYIDGPPVDQSYNSDFRKVINQPTLKTIVLDIRDSTARAILDDLTADKRKASVAVHKNFPMQSLSAASRAFHDIRRSMDKRHIVIELP